MKRTQTVPAASLVMDFDLYPRHAINEVNVAHIVEAMRAGTEIPPVVADRASRRLVDGFHRTRSALRLHGAEATIAVEWREYADQAALLLDAIARNSGHGQKLSTYDKVRSATLAADLMVERDQVAAALRITRAQLDKLDVTRTATVDARVVPIKRTAQHLAGEEISARQLVGIQRAGGKSPLYYVNRVIDLIEYDLLDHENEAVVARLAHLRGLLARWLPGTATAAD